MKSHYILWATGKDRKGIVASIAKDLYQKKCNLEDSAMMRLGSEFGVLLIFTSVKPLSTKPKSNQFASLERKMNLNIGFKSISATEAKFTPTRTNSFLISVHGKDHAGIVYKVTESLSKAGFNITDLSTHRTTKGKTPGYILFIEGEITKKSALTKIKRQSSSLQKKLKVKITIRPVGALTI